MVITGSHWGLDRFHGQGHDIVDVKLTKTCLRDDSLLENTFVKDDLEAMEEGGVVRSNSLIDQVNIEVYNLGKYRVGVCAHLSREESWKRVKADILEYAPNYIIPR